MPRIENIKEPGYYFIVPKKNIPNHPVVEVKSNDNHQIVPDKALAHPMVFKEEEAFKYEIPQAKLLPPSLADLNKDIKYVALNNNNELVEHKMPMVAQNENKEVSLDKDIAMVKPMTLEGAGGKDIAMVKPMTLEGAGGKDIAMVKPMTLEGAGGKDIAMVKPMTLEGAGGKDIAMVKPMTLEGAGGKDIAMVKPMTLEDSSANRPIVGVLPMFKEELVPTERPGVVWSKGVVLSKYPMVQGADLMDSLKEHWQDTVTRMTTGFVDNIKDWMKQKRESLKKEFHNFVSKTMRDYEDAIMNPAQTLVKNAISNPLGTISEFPKNLKTAFSDVGQNLLNTTVDAGVTVGNKAIDTLNAGISAGNTGVEVLNSVNAFFGGKGKTLPTMKTIPRLPSREELLQQATIKGGSFAKLGGASSFDAEAFRDKANQGKIDRTALIGMSSSSVFNNSMPDDYSPWTGMPLWFTLQEDNVTIDEKNPPIILDNTGRETEDRNKEGRMIGQKSYLYMGYREGPFKSAMEGIYRGVLGFQAQPDTMCDIDITPHIYECNTTTDATNKMVRYYPPKYPKDTLGDFMIADFNVQYLTMNTENSWNLGVYGNIPIVTNYILPTSLSIRFVGDANLKTAKWLQAYREYMTGYKLSPHSVRPYKMCCQEITCYALTFYGEVVHAITFYAYPLMKEEYAMLGSGGVKHYDTDWVIVGLREFASKPSTSININTGNNSQLKEQEPEQTTGEDPGEVTTISGENITAVEEVQETEAGVVVTLKTNSADVQTGGVKDSDEHVEKFLDKIKTSQNVVNKLKDVAQSEAVQTLAQKAGIDKILGDLSKLSNLDLLIRTGCNYIVCAYTNHIASPSYKNTGVAYNNADLDSNKQVLEQRFKNCDELAKKRAKEYVQSLINKGVAKDNIKVILASCDGIPGMNHYISGTVMTGGFYLGGIHQYTKAECEMESGDGNSSGLLNNRRVDLIYFEDFVEKYGEAIDEMMGKGSSDARGNDSKLKLLWNRIPKISYGRDTFWGPSYSGKRFPTYDTSIDLGINGFSVSGTTATTSDKETNEEKHQNTVTANAENDLKVESGLGSETDVQSSVEAYKEKEETKATTEVTPTGWGISYKIIDTIKYTDFYNNCQDLSWFNSKFGKKYKNSFFINGKEPYLPTYNNENTNDYFNRCPKLPQSTTNTNLFPVLSLHKSFSFVINNTSKVLSGYSGYDIFMLMNYFNRNDYAWIYSTQDDELRFYQKVTI